MAHNSAIDLPDSVSLHIARAGESRHTEWLSPAELERLDELQREDRRTRFALGRYALRGILADRLNVDPRDVPLRAAHSGHLEVADGVHVSLSHAGRGLDAAAAAAVSNAPIGVDIERVGPRHPDLWKRMLADSELPQLSALGGPTDDAQTLLWVLKEAVLKGQGTGLRAGLRSVRLDVEGRSAESDLSGAWSLRFHKTGDLWVAVAYK